MMFEPNVVIPSLRQLQKGDRVVYHRGFLAVDRALKTSGLHKRDEDLERVRDVALIARTAMELAIQGRARLTQRKIADGAYEYIAIGM